ncbi:hypothetical protein GCM10011409_01420 [Lentibacillus populi]|uniref:ABC-2 type transporter transmembrane domain-containing protein n=1 Tax=Lentibacillus populi TaxID=1827502 RepID=A0A9W5TU40_9BACI|nr:MULTISPECIES: ABC transporter permease [Bacillaceae]GGB27838.1 hypothetical protein GCM10011409_01420 [Lentibacillus populi]
MKYIIETRFLHWKRHWPSLLFWLLIPLIATIGIAKAANAVTDDSKVPVGIVMEDESDAASELRNEIKSTPFIRVYQLEEDVALYRLKKHQLDSVFVIHDGYEEEIREGSRNRLLTSYRSDLSFAYTPVKEMILSYIQQETGRSKAAYTVQELIGHYQSTKQWTWDEIVAKSKEIQSEQDLLKTSFSFGDTENSSQNNDAQLFHIWGLWAIFSLLSTLLLFDWIIHEKHASVNVRFAFMRYSFKHYLVFNFIIYTVLCFIVDLLSVSIFSIIFQEQISIWSLTSFRLTLSIAAFLMANLFRRQFLYYTTAFAIALIMAVASGAIIPNTGMIQKWPWVDMLNPLQPFLSGGSANLATCIIMLFSIIWYFRKEEIHA